MIAKTAVLTQGRPSGGWSFKDSEPEHTFHTLVSLDGAGFDAVRLIFAIDTQNECTVQACVAATASSHDFLNPIDEDGKSAPWYPVTFNNLGLATKWHQQPMGQINTSVGALRSLRLNPPPFSASMKNFIGFSFSDWIPISSFSRIDGGRWPLLMHRTYASGAPRPGFDRNGYGNPGTDSWSGLYSDRILAAWTAKGNYVNDTEKFPSGTESGEFPVLAVQYYSRSRGYSILNLGDSIAGGVGAKGASFALRLALSLSTPESPVTYVMAPWGNIPGVGPNAYFQSAKALFDAVSPSIVFPQLWSRNWGLSKMHVDQAFQEAIQMGQRAREYGGEAIYIAPVPCPGSYSGPTERLRKETIVRVAQLRAGGHLTYDPNPVTEFGTGDFPNRYQTWASEDQCHPNENGHNFIATKLEELLRTSDYANLHS